MEIYRDRGPRGARGAWAPLKIGDLFSKIFGKRQNLIFLFIRAPLEKNHSSAPDNMRYKYSKTASILGIEQVLFRGTFLTYDFYMNNLEVRKERPPPRLGDFDDIIPYPFLAQFAKNEEYLCNYS